MGTTKQEASLSNGESKSAEATHKSNGNGMEKEAGTDKDQDKEQTKEEKNERHGQRTDSIEHTVQQPTSHQSLVQSSPRSPRMSLIARGMPLMLHDNEIELTSCFARADAKTLARTHAGEYVRFVHDLSRLVQLKQNGSHVLLAVLDLVYRNINCRQRQHLRQQVMPVIPQPI